eukprot:2259572-Amphidinium_carterae.1
MDSRVCGNAACVRRPGKPWTVWRGCPLRLRFRTHRARLWCGLRQLLLAMLLQLPDQITVHVVPRGPL